MSQFHQFQNELLIHGELHLETAMHIGRGNSGLFGIDNEVVKHHDGLPFIPGSTLKGTIRSMLERISSTVKLGQGETVTPCISTESLCVSNDPISLIQNRQGKSADKIALEVAEKSCPICHLFGNLMMAGKVQFFDCEVEKQTWFKQYDHRDGVAIDRDTLTAKDKAKYEFEAVPAGTVFHMSIRALNLSELEKVWLVAALEMLRRGEILIGGKVARGLGKVYGKNWSILERTPDNFFKTLLQKKESLVSFEEYVQGTLESLVEG